MTEPAGSRASVAAEPTLYDADGAAVPTLHGRHCTVCGHTFFPPQDYGCESCGAAPEHLAAEDLPGIGTLVASAMVLRHPRAPFTIGTVLLDSGPAARAVIETPEGPVPNGARVHSVLVPAEAHAGVETVELHFASEEA